MKKKIILIMVVLFIFKLLGFSKVVTVFPNLSKPYKFMVDKDRYYIIENQNVYIYSVNENKLIKKFGRKGEGPMEFTGRLNITSNIKNIIVQDHVKASYWTKKGEFIKEVKLKFHFHGNVELLGENKFVLNRFKSGTEKDKTDFNAIVLYDSNFEEIRIIDKKQEGKREKLIGLFENRYYFRNSRTKNMIYVMGHDGKKIDVYDDKGEKLYIIKEFEEKVVITEKDKTEAIRYFNFIRRGHLALSRNKFKFGKFKPAIKDFFEFNSLLYVETWNRADGKTKFYVYDQKGKLIKKIFLPIVMKNYKDNYPYYIDGGKLYQLVENEENETWELIVSKI